MTNTQLVSPNTGSYNWTVNAPEGTNPVYYLFGFNDGLNDIDLNTHYFNITGTAKSTTASSASVVIQQSVTAAGTSKNSGSSSQSSAITTSSQDSTTPSVIGQITAPIVLPFAQYTGQALLTGSCTTAQWTAVSLNPGTILEFPMVGCNDNMPECCPSLSVALTTMPQPTGCPSPIYQNDQVPRALVVQSLTQCPQDYTLTSEVCCP